MKSLPVFTTPRVDRQVDEAVAYYETAQTGLGLRFYASFLEALDTVSYMPRGLPVWRRSMRFVKTKSFPYLILYRVHRLHVDVIAVVHGRSNPRHWLK